MSEKSFIQHDAENEKLRKEMKTRNEKVERRNEKAEMTNEKKTI